MRTNLSVSEAVPSIVVYNGGAPEEALYECLYGIEEEGIPYRLVEASFSDPVAQAHEAARQSILEVGIAVDGQGAVVHNSRLPLDRPILQGAGALRAYGVNAARMVKGVPFVL